MVSIEGANDVLGTITAIEPQRRQTSRANVFIDGKFSFAARVETLARAHVSDGDMLTCQQRDRVLEADAQAAAFDAAISLLASRPRSEREISDRLRRKSFDAPTIEAVLEKLRESKYLDDDAFARFWVENRTSFRPRGEMALRQELRAKGIDREIVDETIAEAGIDDLAMAIDLAQRKAGSMEHLDDATRHRRLIGFLQR